MEYLIRVNTDAEIVSSNKHNIFYSSDESKKVVFKKTSAIYSIELTANGDGVFYINNGYFNADGIRYETLGMIRNVENDKIIDSTKYYCCTNAYLGDFYTTTDISGKNDGEEIVLSVYTYDGETMSEYATLPLTIMKYNPSYTGPVFEIISYKSDDTKVYAKSEIVNISAIIDMDGLRKDNTTLTSIIIPDTVTEIGERAFRHCKNLTSVTMPNTITVIPYEAFESCESLTTITLPDNITEIGKTAFYDCENLNSVTYKGITYTDRAELESALTASGVTIGEEAFDGTSLEEPTDTTDIVE